MHCHVCKKISKIAFCYYDRKSVKLRSVIMTGKENMRSAGSGSENMFTLHKLSLHATLCVALRTAN